MPNWKLLKFLNPTNLAANHLGIWIAFLMLPIARAHWQFQWLAILAKPALTVLVVASLALLMKRFSSKIRVVSIWLATSVLAIALEWSLRQLNTGEPMELLLLELLWCVGIASRFGEGTIATRTSDSIAVFLAAFVFFINPTLPVAVVGSIFALSMILQWLQSYWGQIQSEFVDVTSVERTGSRLLIPALVALVVVATFGTSLRIPVVAKFTSRFSPFSGGEAWADQFAMSGIGDGEALVAAKEMAQTEGPVDSEIFIESKKRSLYDIVSDEYGDAKKPKRNQDINSAVSMTTEKLQKNHKKLASAEKNSATFSLTRESKGKREIPADLNSNVLLLVEDHGPLCLKMQTFDTFDGQQWRKQNEGRQRFYGLTGTEDNDWYCLKRPLRSDALRSVNKLAVSIVHLESQQIPTPPLLEAWSISQVNRMDFYRVYSDQLMMNIGNSVPQFTRVSMINRGFHLPDYVDSDFLTAAASRTISGEDISVVDQKFDSSDCKWSHEKLSLLAEQLTSGFSPGSWQRVDAIVEHLRNNFRHTGFVKAEVPAEDSSSDSETKNVSREKLDADQLSSAPQKITSLRSFIETGEGEDYQFATAAAVMLDQAGFRTRLVQGFYVRPDSFDPRTKKSSVVSSDLHTWLEVQVESDVWVPIEPTPGYLPIPEANSWSDRATDGFAAIVLWIISNPTLTCLFLFMVVIAWWYRAPIAQNVRWVWWRTLVTFAPENSIRWTLDWSRNVCSVAQRRQTHEPIGSWINRLAGELEMQPEIESAFLQTVNRDLYQAPSTAPTRSRQQICFAWVKHLKESLWRQQKLNQSRSRRQRTLETS